MITALRDAAPTAATSTNPPRDDKEATYAYLAAINEAQRMSVPLSDEDIKAAANAKIAAIEAEAQDKACDRVWGRTMTVTSTTSAGMAVTSVVGGMAGPIGIVLWMATAAGIGIAGIVYCKREGEAIYKGDRKALDRWLSDDDFDDIMARTQKVRKLAKAAMENPPALPPLVEETKPAPAAKVVPVEIPIEDDGWQPADLPQPFIPYLASQIHILIAATTGSGKTWVLRNLCTHLANRGDLLCIADPKGSDWGHLKPAAKFMQTEEDYLILFDQIRAELSKRKSRLNQGQPVGKHTWFVFDEWMLAKGKLAWLEPEDQKLVTNVFLDLIVAGRELNMHKILVNQSHFLGDLSLSSGSKNTLSSGLRDNICTLALGCKETTDHEGTPMVGNAKTIDSVLTDQALIKDKADRVAAQQFHAELRRQPDVNRTYAVYASRLYVGQTPDLTIPDLIEIETFPSKAQE